MHIPILYRWIHLSILQLLFLLLQQRRSRSNVPIAQWAWKQKRKLDSLTIKTITKPICFADTTTVGELFLIKLNTTCISLNTIMIKEEFKEVNFLFNLFFFHSELFLCFTCSVLILFSHSIHSFLGFEKVSREWLGKRTNKICRGDDKICSTWLILICYCMTSSTILFHFISCSCLLNLVIVCAKEQQIFH